MSTAPSPGAGRVEHDMLGAVTVPDEAYYGVHTVRALANFPISGETLAARPHLIDALAAVKQAAAAANTQLGALPEPVGSAIAAACAEIRSGRLYDQFVVDLIQGGRAPRRT